MNAGDTAWVLTSAVLVLGMTIPGLAFFYGGLVRRKNVLSILMQCFIIVCVISLQWVLFGYSLAFGPDTGWGIIGGLKWAGLNFVGGQPNADYAATIPHQVFMIFQAMFAIITPALIIGAFAERMKFSAFLIFTVLWATLVYDPLAHWVWGTGGWLRNLGALDFAGGIVVHVSSGVSALTLAILLGKRCGYAQQPFRPHNLPFTVLGAALLWFGWFGFNAGSALGANGLAAQAFVTTNTAGAAGAMAWLLISWLHGKPSSLGFVSGAVAGLVAITPGAGYVTPMAALLIGAIGGALCYGILLFRIRKGIDESLDAWAIHGMGGLWGTLATGIFAAAVIGGFSGLVEGDSTQFLVNSVAAFAALGYAFVVTYIIGTVIDRTVGLRVTEDEEYVGLDICQHGERA